MCPAGENCTSSAGVDESSALLQTRNTWGCAWKDEDPHSSNHNGECCNHPSRPLHSIKGKWWGAQCSFQCKFCSNAGEDVNRFCGSGCGGCYLGGDEVVPCCPGLSIHTEDGRMICRADSRKPCAGQDEDPHGPHFNGQCCPTLVEVLGRWSSAECTSRCVGCSAAGEDVFRFCGSGCDGGCHRTTREYAPCCAGLHEELEHDKFFCRA